MSERIEVEVVNGACRGAACNYYEDGGDGVCVAQVFPGSLTEARLRLADAAIAVIEWGLPEHGDAMYAAYDDYAARRAKRGPE